MLLEFTTHSQVLHKTSLKCCILFSSMLNYRFEMFNLFPVTLVTLLFGLFQGIGLFANNIPMRISQPAAYVSHISITQPQPNQAIQGIVIILGSTNVRNFSNSTLDFSYHDNPTDTWFPISNSSQGVVNDQLAAWDTTIITDNNYTLRLTVTTQTGQTLTYLVDNIRVRNYSPIETLTPGPPSTQNALSNPVLPTMQKLTPMTATPFPTNPVTIQTSDLTRTGLFGILLVFGIFLAGISYVFIQKGSQ